MTTDVDGARTVEVRRGVLEKNDDLAAALRARFAEASVGVSNWVSSPGSGKTALLEKMLVRTAARGVGVAVLVGDCATDNDARRLQATGAPVRQIVTDGLCHLEADLLARHVDELEASGTALRELDLLVIENVGNLVCPTAFDLGESVRVALLSVTEGEDKPLKYPQTFAAADVVVITKVDIADAVEFDDRAAREALSLVAPGRPVLATSARTGEGVDGLADLLLSSVSASPRARPEEVP